MVSDPGREDGSKLHRFPRRKKQYFDHNPKLRLINCLFEHVQLHDLRARTLPAVLGCLGALHFA